MPDSLIALPSLRPNSSRKHIRSVGRVSHTTVWPQTVEDDAMNSLSHTRGLHLLLQGINLKVPLQDEQIVDDLAAKIARELDAQGQHPSEHGAPEHAHDEHARSSPHEVSVINHHPD